MRCPVDRVPLIPLIAYCLVESNFTISYVALSFTVSQDALQFTNICFIVHPCVACEPALGPILNDRIVNER